MMENIGKWSHLSSLTSRWHCLEIPDLCSLQRSPLFLLNYEEEFTSFKMWNAKKEKQTNRKPSGIYTYLIKTTKPISQENPQRVGFMKLSAGSSMQRCTLSSSTTLTYLLPLKQECESSETEGCVSIIYHSLCLHCDGTKGLNKKEITWAIATSLHRQFFQLTNSFSSIHLCSLSFLSIFAKLWFKSENNLLGSCTVLLIFQPSAMHSFCL